MNASNPIAREAIRALTTPDGIKENTWCQKWVRLVCEKALGGKPMGSPNPLSAKSAAFSLLAQGIGKRHVAGMVLQPGDLLYKCKGSGGSGHVGIYIGDNNGVPSVAENSTYHWNATGGRDARGIRTLAQFGHFDVVARFPVADESTVPIAASAPKAMPRAATNDVSVIIVRGMKPVRVEISTDGKLNPSLVHDMYDVAGVEISKEGFWRDGTRALYLKDAA